MNQLLKSYDVDLVHKAETVSTNTDARILAAEGLSRPLLVVADRQTGGRGRTGRAFHSPAGGLYMTLALPCGLPLAETFGVTSSAAVCTARAVESVCGAVPGIKWVNDLYLNGRKLCGILVESVNDYRKMTSETLLIGIGVNLTEAPAITDSSVQAVSLAEAGYTCPRDALCAAAVRELLTLRDRKYDFSAYIGEYTRRSVVLGRQITFTRNGVTRTGTAVSVSETGALLVACEDETVVLDSGEIHLRIQ
ncbi:MAG: biotin--[Clostridia bacterium]|nr:biotin--[acetyl-CoA-carboxylase] ligase [Clostridia bacterium]